MSENESRSPWWQIDLGSLLRRLVLALGLALIGSFLFELFDEIILSDSLDFNDEFPGTFYVYLAFLGIAWFITASKLYQPRSINQDEFTTTINSPVLVSVARQFRKRAARLRQSAYFLLGIVFAVLLIGLMIFQSAERTAVRVDDFYAQDLREKLSSLQAHIRKIKRDQKLTESEKSQVLESASREEDRLKNRLDELTEESSQDATLFWVSTLSTKVGSVLLLLFLVQILVNLYRYNMRLASFYDSRADFLQLLGSTDSVSPEALAKIVGTEKFEFGKAPKTPTEQLLNLAKEVSSLGARR